MNIQNNLSYYIDATNEFSITGVGGSSCNISIVGGSGSNLNDYLYTSNSNNAWQLYLNSPHIDGEIRFTNIFQKYDNYPYRDHAVRINKYGKLECYYVYSLSAPTVLEGWKDVISEIASLIFQGQANALEIVVVQGQIAIIQSELTQVGLDTKTTKEWLETINNFEGFKELREKIIKDQDLNAVNYVKDMFNNYSKAATDKYKEIAIGAGITFAGAGIVSLIENARELNQLSNAYSNMIAYNSNITQENKDITLSNIFIAEQSNISNLNNHWRSLCDTIGCINSNITDNQYIPSLKSDKILLGQITTPNVAYQMEMTGDLNLNMLYLNSTSLSSLLNQKQGNLTFTQPLYNTTNTIGLNYDSSLTKIGNNLSVVKTATTPIVITGNDFSLNYDSSLTKISGSLSVVKTASLPLSISASHNFSLNYDSTLTLSGNNLKVADAVASKWTTLGTNIYNNNIGNIGIEITNPQYKLDVNGNIYGRNNLYIGNSSIISSYTNASINSISGTDYKYLIYTTNGTLVLNDLLNCDILIVGGGGGGGGFGGGGGGGQVLYTTNFTIPTGSYSITIGSGGVGSVDGGVVGGNGNDTTITINGVTYTAKGGGGGGTRFSSTTGGREGQTGGNGGGGAHDNDYVVRVGGVSNKTTYSGWTSLGNSGGSGTIFNQGSGSPNHGSGGGGGAGGIGENFVVQNGTNIGGGNGGAGINLSSIFGNIVGHQGWFGGGGGGNTFQTATRVRGYGNGGNGLLGGGGNGAWSGVTDKGGDGLANTGGGGGGGGYYGTTAERIGGTGGSGVVIIKFTETGKIGLGTTTPNNKLHIEKGSVFIGDNAYTTSGLTTANGYKLIFDNTYNGTAGTGGICNKILLHNTSGFNSGFGIETDALVYQSGNRHKFYTGTTSTVYGFLGAEFYRDNFRFYGSTNAGAGGVISNGNAGASAYSYLSLANDTGNGILFLNSSTKTTDGGANTLTLRNDITGGDLRLSANSDTPYIYLKKSTGRVGVDTTAPAYKLDVNGSLGCTTINSTSITTNNNAINAGTGGLTCGAISSGTITTNNNTITAGTATITAATFSGKINPTVNTWNTSSDGYNRFYFANTSRTYFGSGSGYEWRSPSDGMIAVMSVTGQLGLQNASPIGTLSLGDSSVAGSEGSLVIHKKDSGGGTRHMKMGFYTSTFDLVIGDFGNNNTPGTWVRGFGMGYSAPDYSLYIYGTGPVYAQYGYISGSDIKLKTDIKTIENSLWKVEQLRGVEYKLILNQEENLGLIAQEVEHIIPQVVGYNEQTKTKTINYNGLVGLLVEAIKELKGEINNLNKRIEILENK